MLTARNTVLRESDVLTLALIHHIVTESVSACEHQLSKSELSQMVLHRLIARTNKK